MELRRNKEWKFPSVRKMPLKWEYFEFDSRGRKIVFTRVYAFDEKSV